MEKVVKVQTELAAVLSSHDLPELIHESRLSIRRQPHDLALIAIVREAQELRGRRIHNAKRVWIFNLPQNLDRVPFSDAPHRRDKIAKAIKRQECRAIERRNEEAASQVCAMMFYVMCFRGNRLG